MIINADVEDFVRAVVVLVHKHGITPSEFLAAQRRLVEWVFSGMPDRDKRRAAIAKWCQTVVNDSYLPDDATRG